MIITSFRNRSTDFWIDKAALKPAHQIHTRLVRILSHYSQLLVLLFFPFRMELGIQMSWIHSRLGKMLEIQLNIMNYTKLVLVINDFTVILCYVVSSNSICFHWAWALNSREADESTSDCTRRRVNQVHNPDTLLLWHKYHLQVRLRYPSKQAELERTNVSLWSWNGLEGLDSHRAHKPKPLHQTTHY